MKIMKFEADWCASCIAYKPIFKKAVEEWGVPFKIVNVDKDKETAHKYKVTTIPTTVWLDSQGNEVHRLVGKRELPELVDVIKEFKDV